MIELNMTERAKETGIGLDSLQCRKFKRYYELLISWNEKVNLTAITNAEDVAEKHFKDSMMIFDAIKVPQNAKVIDIGTGAGFPAVPMKIVAETLDVTLVDALQKRVYFLKELASGLELQMEVIHGRAEELIREKNMRGGFDLAVSRAVAKLNTLAEYVLPYVKVGGSFVAWKGPSGMEEMEEAKNAIETLGAEFTGQKEYQLRSGEKRMLLVFGKVRETAKEYPRKNAMIKSKPL